MIVHLANPLMEKLSKLRYNWYFFGIVGHKLKHSVFEREVLQGAIGSFYVQKWKYEKHMWKFYLEYLMITIKNNFFYENEMRHFCKFYLEYLLITVTFLHILPRISAHLGHKILNSRNSELRLQAYSSNPVENQNCQKFLWWQKFLHKCFWSSSAHRWGSLKLGSEFSYLPFSFQNRPLIWYM